MHGCLKLHLHGVSKLGAQPACKLQLKSNLIHCKTSPQRCSLIIWRAGRTTKFSDNPGAEQDSIDDCYVKPGFGLFFSSSSSWAVPGGLTLPTDKIPDDSSIKITECPAGYYGPGGIAAGTLNSLCIKCAAGSFAASGSTTAADCSAACEPGYGMVNGACTQCSAGSWSDGSSLTPCTTCKDTMFVYESTKGAEQAITSKGTTLQEAATASSSCVATRNQLFADAGTSYALDDLAPWTDLGNMTMSQVCARHWCCLGAAQWKALQIPATYLTMIGSRSIKHTA